MKSVNLLNMINFTLNQYFTNASVDFSFISFPWNDIGMDNYYFLRFFSASFFAF